MPKYKYIFINSLLAFVSAFVFTTLLHESAHFISYYMFGAHPVLHHNYVQVPDQNLSLYVKIISAMAGPVVSLLQGIIFGIIIRRPGNNEKYLLFLWLSLLGFVNFFGYLMLTPISKYGDTSRVANFIHLPYPLQIAVGILGISLLIVLVLKVGKRFSNFIPNEENITIKRKYINVLLLFPILTGSIVNALLALPAVVVLSLVYPATSPYVILSSYGKILKSENYSSKNEIIETKTSHTLIIFTLIMFVFNRLLAL